jgi:cell division septation protein DedD
VAAPAKAPASTAKAAAKPTAAASAVDPKPARGYFVDAGIYAEAANARRAIDKLRGAELPAVSEQLQMVRGERTRVRVGPYAELAEARKAAARVKALGLPALVEPRAEPIEPRPLFQ